MRMGSSRLGIVCKRPSLPLTWEANTRGWGGGRGSWRGFTPSITPSTAHRLQRFMAQTQSTGVGSSWGQRASR